ncbi:4691_t:CDS:2 [Acaulospora morrowiae]|uniref:4691_t:CDS:1 n=1 Tax=Acaulospora morrowiae TaxID=94023 RepID=A0A9N8Z7A4_9GLOM|nr:4691_t:CDS:2 [Acaulospora morrowiae]
MEDNPQTTRILPPLKFSQLVLSPIQTSCFIIIGTRDEILKFLESHATVPILIGIHFTDEHAPDIHTGIQNTKINDTIDLSKISRPKIKISIVPYTKRPIGPTALGINVSFNWLKVWLPGFKWYVEFRYDDSSLLNTSTSGEYRDEIVNRRLREVEDKERWDVWAENVKVWNVNSGILLGEVKEIIEKESWHWCGCA